MTVSELFHDPGIGWGLRGDPYLWQALEARMSTVNLPASVEDLVAMIHAEFRNLTRRDIGEERPVYVEEFAHGGMSSGQVYPPWWRDAGIPLLARRYVEVTSHQPGLPSGCFAAYSTFCREERNYAAILYAHLCNPKGRERFAEMCGIFDGSVPSQPYFEFAYLRDWWNARDLGSHLSLLLQHLPEGYLSRIAPQLSAGADRLSASDIMSANRSLGVVGRLSHSALQMPGRWSVTRIAGNFGWTGSEWTGTADDAQDFRRICALKWAFNIKPDLVIMLEGRRAICVEAKLESGEGAYPASSEEKRIFKDLRLNPVRQVELQRYLMSDLLGFDTTAVYLTKTLGGLRRPDAESRDLRLTWADVFAKLADVEPAKHGELWMDDFCRRVAGNPGSGGRGNRRTS